MKQVFLWGGVTIERISFTISYSETIHIMKTKTPLTLLTGVHLLFQRKSIRSGTTIFSNDKPRFPGNGITSAGRMAAHYYQ